MSRVRRGTGKRVYRVGGRDRAAALLWVLGREVSSFEALPMYSHAGLLIHVAL